MQRETQEFLSTIERLTKETETRLKIMPPAMHMQMITQIIEVNDIVFGVYDDRTMPKGWGFEIIKGEQKLGLISALGQSAELKVAAIPCMEVEQAVHVTFNAIGIDDRAEFPSIPSRRRFVCTKCGGRSVSVMPDWRTHRAHGVG